eukprot:Lankesteria_metandrocarpae@DN2054_c0_g1_i1.p1
MSLASYVLLVFPLLLPCGAWWDEGHMIVAAIAAHELGEHKTHVLEQILSSWNETYPGMSTLSVAATWPDHVKCASNRNPFCRGLTHLDSMEIFNTWHYSSLVLNPHNLEIEDSLYHVADVSGAYWALAHLFSSVTGAPLDPRFQQRRSPREDSGNSTDPHNSTWSSHHHQHSRGSVLSWNLQLRLLIHIFGDLHQPLHAAETFTHALPHGDAGGSRVHISVENADIHTLHAFVDSCGGVYNRSWPELSSESVSNIAKRLIEKYPRTVFKERLSDELNGLNFWSLALESHERAASVVYDAELLAHLSGATAETFSPSDAYVERVQAATLDQLMVGGYRLSNVLQHVIAPAERFLDGESAKVASSSETSLGGVSFAAAMGARALEGYQRNQHVPALHGTIGESNVEDIVESRCNEEIENIIFFRQSLVVCAVMLGVSILFNIAATWSYFRAQLRAEQSQAVPQTSRLSGFFSSVKGATVDFKQHGTGYLRVGYEMPLMSHLPAEACSAVVSTNGSGLTIGRGTDDVWNFGNKFAPEHQLCSSCSVQKRQILPAHLRNSLFGVIPNDHRLTKPPSFDKEWPMHRPDPPPYDFLGDT